MSGSPPAVPSVVERNAAKYALLQRSDTALRNTSLADKLQRRGMTLNVADTAGFRDRVGDLYKRWKDEFGDTARGLLESHCGKLA